MAQRNRLLEDGVRDGAQLDGLEIVMAETGVAIAAARAEAVAALAAVIAARRARDARLAFPLGEPARWKARSSAICATVPAVDVEDGYCATLRQTRERDRAAGRTLDGPHRTDLVVATAPRPCRRTLCSTGEQKALLLGLVLAHAELVGRAPRRRRADPAAGRDRAHLDEARRAALFAEILRSAAQAWMTGTDASAFTALANGAQFFRRRGRPIARLSPAGR